jgi:GR25 family glycosyltransferase involved in LPS biosynthesis
MIYSDGLNNFDVIYYINLDHRKDRYEHITKELSKTNIDETKIKKISGIYVKELGILGCAKSHCLALEEFIKSGKDNCIIFEDDFQFTENQDFINSLINRVFNELKDFDVVMLSANILNDYSTGYEFITKIIDAQTLSGYAVSKTFAPILLNNYRESIGLLESVGVKVHPFCFDIYMKRLQPFTRWYCLNPKIGKQIESYSDIENRVVDYDC